LISLTKIIGFGKGYNLFAGNNIRRTTMAQRDFDAERLLKEAEKIRETIGMTGPHDSDDAWYLGRLKRLTEIKELLKQLGEKP